MVDQPPHLPIQSVRITGEQDYPPMDLLAAWLTLRLNVPVTMEIEPNAQAITGVYLTRKDGELVWNGVRVKRALRALAYPASHHRPCRCRSVR